MTSRKAALQNALRGGATHYLRSCFMPVPVLYVCTGRRTTERTQQSESHRALASKCCHVESLSNDLPVESQMEYAFCSSREARIISLTPVAVVPSPLVQIFPVRSQADSPMSRIRYAHPVRIRTPSLAPVFVSGFASHIAMNPG